MAGKIGCGKGLHQAVFCNGLAGVEQIGSDSLGSRRSDSDRFFALSERLLYGLRFNRVNYCSRLTDDVRWKHPAVVPEKAPEVFTNGCTQCRIPIGLAQLRWMCDGLLLVALVPASDQKFKCLLFVTFQVLDQCGQGVEMLGAVPAKDLVRLFPILMWSIVINAKHAATGRVVSGKERVQGRDGCQRCTVMGK